MDRLGAFYNVIALLPTSSDIKTTEGTFCPTRVCTPKLMRLTYLPVGAGQRVSACGLQRAARYPDLQHTQEAHGEQGTPARPTLEDGRRGAHGPPLPLHGRRAAGGGRGRQCHGARRSTPWREMCVMTVYDGLLVVVVVVMPTRPTVADSWPRGDDRRTRAARDGALSRACNSVKSRQGGPPGCKGYRVQALVG